MGSSKCKFPGRIDRGAGSATALFLWKDALWTPIRIKMIWENKNRQKARVSEAYSKYSTCALHGAGRSEAGEICIPLREQFVTSKIARLMQLLVEISMFRLDGIGSQQDSSLWRAIDIIIQDALLHLEEKEALRDVLNQLLWHILWVELGTELEEQRAFLAYILCGHLEWEMAPSSFRTSQLSGAVCNKMGVKDRGMFKKHFLSDTESKKPWSILPLSSSLETAELVQSSQDFLFSNYKILL